jgi:hypothetical protein
MNPSSPVSHSRWARASFYFSVFAFLAGLAVVGIRVWGGPWASLLGSLLAMPLGFWVIVRTSLYRRVYRGKSLAMVGFLFSFLGFSDAVGQLSYHRLWRQAFRLTGPETVFENSSEGWKIRYPGQWSAYSLKTREPPRSFLNRRKQPRPSNFRSPAEREPIATIWPTVARDFLLALPKSGETQILFQGEIPYPLYQHAYQVVYEDPTPSVVLRHRLIFLSNPEGLIVLSVAAVPSWSQRLSADADRFLLSFEPIG